MCGYIKPDSKHTVHYSWLSGLLGGQQSDPTIVNVFKQMAFLPAMSVTNCLCQKCWSIWLGPQDVKYSHVVLCCQLVWCRFSILCFWNCHSAPW